jgi:hypothetical protein
VVGERNDEGVKDLPYHAVGVLVGVVAGGIVASGEMGVSMCIIKDGLGK